MSCNKRTFKEEEIIVELSHVRYHNSENQWTIFETKDHQTCCGLISDITYLVAGYQYKLFGRWSINAKYGRQFKFDQISKHLPLSQNAVVHFLIENCNGIGPAKANQLWHQFGSETINVLRDQPERIPEDLLSPEQCRLLSRELNKDKSIQTTQAELFGLLKGRGFGRKIYDKAIELWSCKAPEIIRRNPFALQSYRLPGAGFKRCDKLWLELGKPKDALKRQVLALCAALQNDRDGNTWIPGESVVEKINEMMSGGRPRPKEAIKLGIRAKRLSKIRDAAGHLFLSLNTRAAHEERIVRALQRLRFDQGKLIEPEWPIDAIQASQTEGDGLPSTHQIDELKKATGGPVGCFTGGPGSGKTHTLAYLLRAIRRNFHGASVRVAAPTGKAAVRATESLKSRSLDLRATTIHQLLEIGRNGNDGDGWGFERNAYNPLDVDFLIVDESSMIDCGLMADLLEACKPGTHVLFVGDTNQLPPVGHGSPFRDLIEAGLPTGQLTEIRRNAGTIVRVCATIRDGGPLTLPTMLDLDATPAINVKLIDSNSTRDSVDKVLEIVSTMKRWNPVWQTQIIVAKNDKSEVSRRALNAKLQPILNRDGKRDKLGRNPFAVDDKIICLRNMFLPTAEPDPLGKSELPTDPKYWFELPDEPLYVANGEIGRVLAVNDEFAIARFGDFSTDRESKTNARFVKIRVKAKPEHQDEEGEESDANEFDLAYAITVHKSQGSESPCVIVIADEGSGAVAGREWWYTAISRASQACLIIGKQQTIEKQVKIQRLSRRKTFLKELITGEIQIEGLQIEGLNDEPEQEFQSDHIHTTIVSGGTDEIREQSERSEARSNTAIEKS